MAQGRICFIGMWGARKGARDWSGIIQRIRGRVPKAQFRFLGTMVDSKAILPDLRLDSLEGVEFISDYQPDDLPGLLADCTVGAFPSYAEGFGLAVLEQLAAGIPTIAYDTAGPRDLLGGRLPELLVPKGDIDAFAEKICGILQLDLDGYQELFERSAEAAAKFSWPAIAQVTVSAYRAALAGGSVGKILFVQPFSLGSAGGGARILRALSSALRSRGRAFALRPKGQKPGQMKCICIAALPGGGSNTAGSPPFRHSRRRFSRRYFAGD